MNWPLVPLGELGADIPNACVGGPFGSELTTRDYVDTGVPVIRGTNLAEQGFVDDGFVYVSEEKAESLRQNQARPGDIAFTQRGTIGQVALIPKRSRHPRYVISQSQMKLTPDLQRVDPRYLVHFFKSPHALAYLQNNTLATGVPHINLTILRRLPVPLPPLPEQRRIADILDKADAIRRKRKQAIALTDQLLRSTFLEMFGDPVTNPKRWAEIPFGSLVAETQLGLVRAASEQGPNLQYPYIRMNAIEDNGKLNLSDLSKVDASSEDAMKHQLKEGDFLFNTRNTKELVGKSAVFHGNGLYLFNNNILRVRFRDEYDPDYICSYFQTRRGKADLEKRKSGTTSVFAVYQRSLNEIPILMPPADMQRKYASVCSRVRTITDKLQTSLYCTTNLFDSLVSHTFRGELSTSNQFELQLSMFNK